MDQGTIDIPPLKIATRPVKNNENMQKLTPQYLNCLQPKETPAVKFQLS